MAATGLLSGLGLFEGPTRKALAEAPEADPPPPPTKVVQSQLGNFVMDIPEKWKTETDSSQEKLLFAYTFYNKKFDDYIAVRAEQFDIGDLLRGEQQSPSKSDLAASSWADVIRAPAAPEQVALWVFRHRSRMEALKSGALQGSGGRVVEEDGQPRRQDTVVDARLLNDGIAKDQQGSALVFHVRTITPKREDSDVVPQVRYWAAKAVLRDGGVTVGFVTATEEHWLPGAPRPMDGAFLDSIADSLRLLPPPEA